MLDSSRRAATGAFWGIGLFLVLWIGMLGSLGEGLLLTPALSFLNSLGVDAATLGGWLRYVFAVILSAILFAAGGALLGGGPLFEDLPRKVRNIGIVIITLLILVIIHIGRNLRIH